MARQNPDGSKGESAKEQEKRIRWTAIAEGEEAPEFPTDSLDTPLLISAIQDVVQLGSAITFSLTRDKSGMIIGLYNGDKRVNYYANGPADVVEKLRSIIRVAESQGAPPCNLLP